MGAAHLGTALDLDTACRLGLGSCGGDSLVETRDVGRELVALSHRPLGIDSGQFGGGGRGIERVDRLVGEVAECLLRATHPFDQPGDSALRRGRCGKRSVERGGIDLTVLRMWCRRRRVLGAAANGAGFAFDQRRGQTRCNSVDEPDQQCFGTVGRLLEGTTSLVEFGGRTIEFAALGVHGAGGVGRVPQRLGPRRGSGCVGVTLLEPLALGGPLRHLVVETLDLAHGSSMSLIEPCQLLARRGDRRQPLPVEVERGAAVGDGCRGRVGRIADIDTHIGRGGVHGSECYPLAGAGALECGGGIGRPASCRNHRSGTTGRCDSALGGDHLIVAFVQGGEGGTARGGPVEPLGGGLGLVRGAAGVGSSEAGLLGRLAHGRAMGMECGDRVLDVGHRRLVGQRPQRWIDTERGGHLARFVERIETMTLDLGTYVFHLGVEPVGLGLHRLDRSDVEVRAEQLAQHLLAVGGLGQQELGELALREEHDLLELWRGEAEQLDAALADGARLRDLGDPGAALPAGELGRGVVGGGAAAGLARPILAGGALHPVAPTVDLELERHLGERACRCVVRAHVARLTIARYVAEQSEGHGIEDGALAGAGGAGDREQAQLGEHGEIDVLGTGVRTERGEVQLQRPHARIASSIPCTSAASSAAVGSSPCRSAQYWCTASAGLSRRRWSTGTASAPSVRAGGRQSTSTMCGYRSAKRTFASTTGVGSSSSARTQRWTASGCGNASNSAMVPRSVTTPRPTGTGISVTPTVPSAVRSTTTTCLATVSENEYASGVPL